MRTRIVLIAIGLGVAFLVYRFIPEGIPTSSFPVAPAQPGARSDPSVTSAPARESELKDKLDEVAAVLDRYRKESQEHWKQVATEQTRLGNALADLKAGLKSGASTGAGDQEDRVPSDDDAKGPEAKDLSEGDLGRWIDESLHVGNVKREATNAAIEQAATSLEKSPEIILEDMKCGDAFCRATFSGESGERPALQDLYGQPPFDNEGFTIDETDGRVTLYFTQKNVSLEAVRNEARKTAQLYSGQ